MSISAAAYLITVVTMMALLLLVAFPGSRRLQGVAAVGGVFTLLVLFWLKWNLWALAMLAVSPIPLLLQRPPRLGPLLFTIFMAMGGAFFLFKDEAGQPILNYALAGMVSIVCGQILWSAFRGQPMGDRRSAVDYHQSVVGLIGTVVTEIEAHGTGAVELEGETWVARSHQPVAVGKRVRVMRQDDGVLTVKIVPK